MSATTSATAECSNAKQEAEVIPSTVVMHLVDVEVPAEQRDDEGDGRREAIPQPIPEAGDMSLL